MQMFTEGQSDRLSSTLSGLLITYFINSKKENRFIQVDSTFEQQWMLPLLRLGRRHSGIHIPGVVVAIGYVYQFPAVLTIFLRV